jgi:hypothetical protein
MNSSILSQVVLAAACSLIFAVPLAVAVRRRLVLPFFMGSLFWAGAVFCKILTNLFLEVFLTALGGESANYSVGASVVFGLVSAGWELGTTVLYLLVFRRMAHTAGSIALFALGAAGLEAVIFGAGPLLLRCLNPELHATPLVMNALVLGERIVASGVHVTTRILVFAGLPGAGRPKPALWAIPAAVILFAIVDGLAGYAAAPGRWDFDQPPDYVRLLLVVLAVAVVGAVLSLIALWKRAGVIPPVPRISP